MAVIRKQHRNFKIRVTSKYEYPFSTYYYKVTGTEIKGTATSANDAICFAMDDIEDHFRAMSTK